ncbi:ribosomal protein S5 domain 2-type protein, partial [Ochromonadaceae sp. CCMP2298]
IKKSKFFARAAPAKTFAEASAFMDGVRDPKASHNCWAYRSKATTRCSDDGEPSGTAGKPILNILEAENIIDTVLIVTRYFGGTKLGAGGLIRAYGGAAKLAILATEKIIYIPTCHVSVLVPLEGLGSLYQAMQ